MLVLKDPRGDNQHAIKGGGDIVTTIRANDTAKGNSAAYLAARLKKGRQWCALFLQELMDLGVALPQ